MQEGNPNCPMSNRAGRSYLPWNWDVLFRTFINRLAEEGPGKTLVSTIISLAHVFGMSVVAEGVETEDQLGLLWEMGCDQAQGFLLGTPVPSDVFAELLEQGKGRLKFLAGRREVTAGDES
jgi:predicted signal transduction protein with EAL and GGDEF domain